MKAINFINWKYIGLAGCLVMSLLAACSDDETASEVVTPLEPKLEIVNESSTFSFSSAGNSAQVLTFNTNQNWYIVLDDSEGVDNNLPHPLPDCAPHSLCPALPSEPQQSPHPLFPFYLRYNS